MNNEVWNLVFNKGPSTVSEDAYFCWGLWLMLLFLPESAPATECMATKCHMDPVPQATQWSCFAPHFESIYIYLFPNWLYMHKIGCYESFAIKYYYGCYYYSSCASRLALLSLRHRGGCRCCWWRCSISCGQCSSSVASWIGASNLSSFVSSLDVSIM